jgi:hypothetical protein
MKYLPLYKEWIKTGKMPWRGLCGSLPDNEEMSTIFEDNGMGGYWGYNGKNVFSSDIWHDDKIFDDTVYTFTPLRQNIVLLLAAMNNEL